MPSGKVKSLNSRGFGFIEADNGVDFFFHYSAYKGDFRKLLLLYVRKEDGDKVNVEFDLDPTATDGPRAINVKLAGG